MIPSYICHSPLGVRRAILEPAQTVGPPPPWMTFRRIPVIKSRFFVVCLGLAAIPGAAGATLMNGASFTPSAPTITFATPGDGGVLVDPSYALSTPGGPVTVSFGLYFEGQTVQTDYPFSLATQQPTGPLTLAHNLLIGAVEITEDLSPGATSPVLAGQPSFFGPVAIHFSQPVLAVGLRIGFLDAVGTVAIEAYDAAGVSLGSVTNGATGFELFSLSASTAISGLSIYVPVDEDSGFAIDDVTFAVAAVAAVPEPATLGILALSRSGLVLARRRGRSARR